MDAWNSSTKHCQLSFSISETSYSNGHQTGGWLFSWNEKGTTIIIVTLKSFTNGAESDIGCWLGNERDVRWGLELWGWPDWEAHHPPGQVGSWSQQCMWRKLRASCVYFINPKYRAFLSMGLYVNMLIGCLSIQPWVTDATFFCILIFKKSLVIKEVYSS